MQTRPMIFQGVALIGNRDMSMDANVLSGQCYHPGGTDDDKG